MILELLLGFIISLIISAIIIYLSTKMFGEEEGFGTAILASFIGAILFTAVHYFIGIGWIASLIGGIAWLIVLGSLYKIGWLKSFTIAIVIWIFSALVNWALPIIITRI